MLVRNPCVRDARVLRESAALASADHDVTVVAVLEPGIPAREERDGVLIVRIDPVPRWQRMVSRSLRPRTRIAAPGAGARAASTTTRRPWLRTLLYDRAVSRAFTRAARSIPADAYHAHDLNMLPAALRAARARDAAVVYDSHELYPEMNGLGPRERARWARAERRLIGKADRVLTVNGSLATELVKRYGIAKPAVVMNVPDPSRGRAHPIERKGIVVLYIGWIVAGRGIEQAVEALQYLDEASLVLLGQERGDHGDRIRSIAGRLGVADRVVFAGAVPPQDVVATAAAATVGLCTIRNVGLSYFLSLPNKFFEYLHAGLPVVASDFPELRSVLESYGAGITCDPEDPRSIASAIGSVIADPARYEGLRRGAQRAAHAFTWAGESRKLVELYAGLDRP